MTDTEYLAILGQGIEVWNKWRQENPNIKPNLKHANLRSTGLRYADLRYADLRYADFSDSDLRYADLRHADLAHSNLGFTDVSDADLRYADLSNANLSAATLRGTNLEEAIVWETVFAHIDLREVKGLTEIRYKGPSRVELYTILLPQDGSALHFLRNTGVPDEWIDYYRAHMMSPIYYHSLFLSYSSKDGVFARRLYADLQARGVRCWFAPEDMKTGDKIRDRIDEAIHVHDKLLLLLSEHAIASDWVEDEVEAALEKENRQQREVLFPVRLDDSVMQASQAWAAKLRRTRHIGDFSRWTDPQAYQLAFERLLRDLHK